MIPEGEVSRAQLVLGRIGVHPLLACCIMILDIAILKQSHHFSPAAWMLKSALIPSGMKPYFPPSVMRSTCTNIQIQAWFQTCMQNLRGMVNAMRLCCECSLAVSWLMDYASRAGGYDWSSNVVDPLRALCCLPWGVIIWGLVI